MKSCAISSERRKLSSMRQFLIRLGLAVGLATGMALPALAISYTGSETITVTGSAIGLTASKINAGSGHAGAVYAMCRNEGAQIRFTVDPAVTVTATTNGALVNDGEWLPGLNDPSLLGNFRAIITGLTTSKLQCFYFG